MRLDKKQKVLITLIIIAVAFLAWQLYDMFFAGADQNTPAQPTTTQLQPLTPVTPTQSAIPTITPTTTTTATTSTVTHAPTPVPQQPVETTSVTTTTLAPTQATPVTLPRAVPVPVQPTATIAPAAPSQPQIRQMPFMLPMMTAAQAEYLRLVNRYQIVRMKRLVVDEEAAIAQSQEKIAQLDQQMAKIGGQTPSNNANIPATASITGYQLMYVDNQSGEWTATLSKGNRFIQVMQGKILADGTRVIRIDENGVVILQHGNYYLLNFYGTTHLTHFYNAPVFKRVLSSRPMPKTVIIKSTQPTPRVKIIPWRKEVPVQCVGNSPNCAPQKTLAMNTPVQPQNTAEKPLIAQPQSNVTKNIMLLQTPAPTHAAPQNSAPSLIATANAAPPTKPIAIQNNSLTTQPAPLLQPQPPKTLPLKPQNNLLALTREQKTKVTQIELTTPGKSAIFNIDSFSTDEKHLLAAPANYFTLQLIGNNNLSTLTDFIKNNNLTNAYTYHTFYLNKDWFVMLYGVFKTQQEALNAIKQLPPAAQKLKPWVRTLASVQEAIKLAPASR